MSAQSAQQLTDPVADLTPTVSLGPDSLWISWERHRRSRELSRSLGTTLLEVVSSRRRPWRYLEQAWTTAISLIRLRPPVVVVQCPSVFLGLLAVLLRPILRYRLALDLHNECVEPKINTGQTYARLLEVLWRWSDVSIVTNSTLARMLDGYAPAVSILPDRIPDMKPGRTSRRASHDVWVVLICTYARDEPYREVIESARLISPGITLFVTGNPARAASPLPTDIPANVRICGFLPEGEYEQLLKDADVLVDLTDLDNCLVCGAYEAVALEKPLVTSDTAALREYFRAGTLYAAHTPESLAHAIDKAVASRAALTEEIRRLRPVLDDSWDRQRSRLLELLQA